FEDEFAADDADGADNRAGIGYDIIAGAGEVITAAGGHAADADDHRLALGHSARGLPHHLTGHGAAAGRINPDHNRLDILIAGRHPHGLAEIFAADLPAAAQQAFLGFAIDNHALGIHQ